MYYSSHLYKLAFLVSPFTLTLQPLAILSDTQGAVTQL